MKPLAQLRGGARRRCMKLLRRVRTRGCVWVRCESQYRDAERLHRVGLVTAVVSKWSWGNGSRPFRELALYPTEADARKMYRTILPRTASR